MPMSEVVQPSLATLLPVVDLDFQGHPYIPLSSSVIDRSPHIVLFETRKRVIKAEHYLPEMVNFPLKSFYLFRISIVQQKPDV